MIDRKLIQDTVDNFNDINVTLRDQDTLLYNQLDDCLDAIVSAMNQDDDTLWTTVNNRIDDILDLVNEVDLFDIGLAQEIFLQGAEFQRALYR